jgi:small GTP-binding protein
MTEADFVFKIVVVGDSGAGKTSLLNRFADGQFVELSYSTIGIDFKIKVVQVLDRAFKLQIVRTNQWDTAGQERFRNITAAYFRGASGVVVLYDVSQRATFDSVISWVDEVDAYCPNAAKILLAAKSDVDNPQVSVVEGQTLAKSLGVEFFEVSSKTDINVHEAFQSLTKAIYSRTPEAVVEHSKLSPAKPKPKKSCC